MKSQTFRAVIYVRVSTKEQVSNLSLPTQLRACREYAEREGWEVAEIFEDAGESAKTVDRPNFSKMLHYCADNKRTIQFVLVHSLSRFSRNTSDHAVVRTLLRKLGITLRSVTEPIGDDPVGRFTENIMAAVSQFDNDHRAKRTREGMTEALRLGRWTWKAPLGYINGNPKVGEPSLQFDSIRAPLVRQAFEMVASGRTSIREALRTVTAAGLGSKAGKPLTPQAFGTILRNPIYSGVVQSAGLDVGEVRGDFRPIVAADTFHRVQRVLGRSGGPREHALDHPDFPLRRFVLCGACETPLTGSASKGRSQRYRYYHCRRCGAVRVRNGELESKFADLLATLQPQPEFMRLFRRIVLDAWKERGAETRSARSLLETRLANLQHREQQVEDAWFDERIDRKSYERQRDKVRTEIALTKTELSDTTLEELDVEGVLGFAEHVLTGASKLWIEATSEQKRRLQAVFFPNRITFLDGQFGTAVTCMAFKQLQALAAPEEGLASPPGFEPGSWP